jgi:hypothetical protein
MKRARWHDYRFSPEEHERELLAIIRTIEALPEVGNLDRILRRHPATVTLRRAMPISPSPAGSWKR